MHVAAVPWSHFLQTATHWIHDFRIESGEKLCRALVDGAGLFNSNLLMADQAAINAGFEFRRYAIKPMPAKPRIIIAHVEGSGTALVGPSASACPNDGPCDQD